MNATPEDLLRGLWYALESCGEGLQAAADLFEHGHYARAAAVAMAARDELGKARLLRDLWRRAAGGGSVTSDEVYAICGKHAKGVPIISHVDKQRAAQGPATLSGGPGDPIGAAMERSSRASQKVSALRAQGVLDPSDPLLIEAYAEWNAAEAAVDEFYRDAQERGPGERYELRNRGLYVDVTVDAGKIGWRRPNEITYDEARDALIDAINAYLLMVNNLEPPFVGYLETGGSPAFAAALAA